jgi:hypothetical protein
MKKLSLITLCAFCAILFASCNKDYKYFVGTWGVEKIDYYNIDYAGNPIAATVETYVYSPEDTNNGIQLIFRNDQTGEMRDSAVDTVWIWSDETESYDSYIFNPDTVLVTPFTFSYDKKVSALYCEMKYTYPYTYTRTFRMKIYNQTDSSFDYENLYETYTAEHAYLKRLSNSTSKEAARSKMVRPHKHGSMLNDK